jgi:hypothetical protein
MEDCEELEPRERDQRIEPYVLCKTAKVDGERESSSPLAFPVRTLP